MLFFVNDYCEGAHEAILRRLVETNMEKLPGYGFDKYTESAKEKIRNACGCPEAEVYLLGGGTQTNAVVIASMLNRYEGVIAAETGHVNGHEAGAIEYTGHKVLALPQVNGKLQAETVKAYVERFYGDANHEHMVFPGMVYISHPTEYGTLYTKKELEELSAVCRQYEMPLFLDGARLGYGLVSKETDVTLEDIARLTDVFYIGGTKVGALCGEAVVFPKKAPKYFMTLVKQQGALLAKGRLAGVQFDTLFTDDLYCKISKNAIETADRLKQALKEKGYQAESLEGGYAAWLLDVMSKPEEQNKAKDVELSLRKKFKKSIWSKFTKAINTYELVKPGDKIAVCISGGKDSMLMAKCFQELKLHNKFEFEVKFLVMDPGYSEANRKVIEENAKSLNIPITIFESDIFESVFTVEKSPCYLCARMRRGHLYHFAQELGCNKIALGHHYDDVIETILMGMLYGAQVQTMMPKLHSIHFEGMELIRPLYLVREDDIKAWRDYNGLHFIQCACKFTDTCTTCNNEENRSKRVEIKELIKNLKKVNPFVESNIFRSVENVNIDTVVGYKQHGIRHNFLEGYDDNPGYVPEAEKAAAETE